MLLETLLNTVLITASVLAVLKCNSKEEVKHEYVAIRCESIGMLSQCNVMTIWDTERSCESFVRLANSRSNMKYLCAKLD